MGVMQNIINGVAIGGSIIGAVAVFKAVDWLIGLKYMTKDSCASCRTKVEAKQNDENIKLTRIETKVDLIIGAFNIVPKE